MNIIQTISFIVGIILGIGVIVTGIFYSVSNIRKQDLDGLRSDNDDLRKRLTDRDTIVADLQLQINSMREEVAKMKGKMEEKDKKIEALSHIEMKFPQEYIAYMADMRNFTTQVHQYMVDSRSSQTKIETLLTSRTPIIQDIEENVKSIIKKK